MSETPLIILYQDDRYMAVHKPAGLLVHRSPVDKYETRFCIQLLRDQIGQHVYPCHRLDKPTSGVLLFALDKAALKGVSGQFSEHAVSKAYRALVRGWLEESGEIDHPLRYIPDAGQTRGGGEPQDAMTRFSSCGLFEVPEPVGKYPTGRYSLVELSPETGRQHQLRRHMKHLDHHIIGDTRYGDGVHNRFFRERYSSHRLMLVAVSLIFTHPFSGNRIQIRTPVDRDFQSVIDSLTLRA